MSRVLIVLLLLFSVLVAGCAKNNKQPAEQERIITVLAEKDINPNRYNQAAPLSLFIYQLRASENFQEQDDELFYLPDMRRVTSFSQDVIAMRELIIKPGEKREVRFPRHSDEITFGIIAAFREVEKAEWKREIAFPKDKVRPWYKKFFSIPESKVIVKIKKLSIEAKVME